MEQQEVAQLEALHKWAKRVWQAQKPASGVEARNAARRQIQLEIVLIPFDEQTLRPIPEQRVVTFTRDISANGIGLVFNAALAAQRYFGETRDPKQLYLLRKVRERRIRGSVNEYGLQIIDRFANHQELIACLQTLTTK